MLEVEDENNAAIVVHYKTISVWNTDTGRGCVFIEGTRVGVCRKALRLHGTFRDNMAGAVIAFATTDITKTKKGDRHLEKAKLVKLPKK